jgi:mediator of RNA polymerase II transcription subunit 21
MSAALRQIRENAPPSVPEGQQLLDTFAQLEARTAAENTQQTSTTDPSQHTNAPPAKPSPEQFQADLKEMAQDITLKEQQIERLIAHLPGLNWSEKEQVDRMKELERQLEDLEGERVKAVKDKEILMKMVEDKITGVGRVR